MRAGIKIMGQCTLAAFLLGYGSVSNGSSLAQKQSLVLPSGPQNVTVMAIQECVKRELISKGLNEKVVMIANIGSDAAGGVYAAGLPQVRYTTYATAVVRELGFKPIVEADQTLMRGIRNGLMPDIFITGAIVGFDGLINRWREASDGGLTFGKGFGGTNLTHGNDTSVSLGQVSATINVETLKNILKGDVAFAVYQVTGTATSAAEFRMTQDTSQTNASIIIGIGGGIVREKVSVVDVQSAALFSIRMAIVLAIADQMKINTPNCFL